MDPGRRRGSRYSLNSGTVSGRNRHSSSLTVEVSQALDTLRGHASVTPPTASDFWEAWRQDHAAGLEPDLPPAMRHAPVDHRLHVPSRLTWREGRYAHQGRAVDALLRHGGGILAIATGGGKTITALIAAAAIQEVTQRHLCVVVVVPSRPLVRQWTEAINAFGIAPVVLSGGKSIQKRTMERERVGLAFATDQPRTEVIVMTNALFARTDSRERLWLTKLAETVEVVLVADEVHNLGTPSFIANPPEFFTRRIGLSATPIRQYDPDGTDQLFDYFGGPPGIRVLPWRRNRSWLSRAVRVPPPCCGVRRYRDGPIQLSDRTTRPSRVPNRRRGRHHGPNPQGGSVFSENAGDS